MSDTIFDVPKKQSLDRAAADSLRSAITDGRLEPGTRLTEARLAEQLSLSRGTIRSALMRLAAEGLVVQKPYSSWEVVSLTVEDAVEIASLRGSLEALGAGLAAQHMSQDNRARLIAGLDAFAVAVASGDRDGVVDADLHLHQAIIAMAGSRRLSQHYELVANQALIYIRYSTRIVGDPAEIIRRHEILVGPILSGSAAEAERAAKEHSRISGEEIVRSLTARL